MQKFCYNEGVNFLKTKNARTISHQQTTAEGNPPSIEGSHA